MVSSSFPDPTPGSGNVTSTFTGSGYNIIEGGAIVACMTGLKMPSILSVRVLIVAASIVVVYESAPLEQAQTPPVGKFPGPCRYIVSS